MEIHHPHSLEELFATLDGADGEAKIVAGGTALVLMLRQGLIAPSRIASLQRIEGLNEIVERNGYVAIGATATLREVAATELVRANAPALATACGLVGNIRIRNAGTLGGNIAEADYASDPPAALVALGASVEIAGPDGLRVSTVEDLFTGFYGTTLDSTEVITSILIPISPEMTRQAYVKYRSRSSEDRPCVGVAVWMRLEEDSETVGELRVAVGAAASTPQRFTDTERLAHGTVLEELPIEQIADGYAEQIEALEDFRGSAWYRKQMTREFVRRAVDSIVGEGKVA
ncbi:MAG: xanthine dehydrogenase family protein subunit M [Thermomicrobiales bacterium]